jgi:hypothetical protein
MQLNLMPSGSSTSSHRGSVEQAISRHGTLFIFISLPFAGDCPFTAHRIHILVFVPKCVSFPQNRGGAAGKPYEVQRAGARENEGS